MTHDSMIEVIAAHRDGKVIEFRSKIAKGAWREIQPAESVDDSFDFSLAEYRIKPPPPKPREWWILESPPFEFTECKAIPKIERDVALAEGMILVREVLPLKGEEKEIL